MWEDQGTNITDTIFNMESHLTTAAENQDALNHAVEGLNSDPAIQMQKALGDLKIALEPVLTVIASAISKIAEWVSNNPTLAATIAAVGSAIGILVGIAMGLAPIITAITTAVGVFGVSVGAIAAPIGIAVAAIAGLIAVGIALYTHWDEIKAKAAELRQAIQAAWDNIKQKTAETWENIKQAVSNAWQAVINLFAQVSPVGIIIAHWDEINAKTAEIWASIRQALQELWQAILTFWKDTTPVGIIVGHWDEIKAKTTEIWSMIREWLANLWQQILTKAQTTWANIKNFINEVTNSIKEKFDNLVESALDWGKNLISNFIAGIQSMWDSLLQTVSDAAGVVSDFLGFSSPTKRGPGSEADKWAPAFVDMFAQGILDSLPQLQDALSSMAITLRPGAPDAPGGGTTNNYGGNTITIHVTGGWDEIERELYRRGIRI
jgi:broad specificity phosphatase PhoE